MLLLFLCTLFLSSTLLFLVQPMIAKMVLPLLGGTPAVWNTCMVFFQATLLLGYLYVDAVTRWLRVRQQAALHLVLLCASLLALPIALAAGDGPPASGMPIFWLARVLLFTVGVPFFVVSTTGPLLQRWFVRTNQAGARDPYFLSVAGNLGSIVALIAYPAGLEPMLRLAEQRSLWATCYTIYLALMIASVLVAYRHIRHYTTIEAPAAAASQDSPAAPVPLSQKLRWLLLAFIPSSLMLGLTTYLTTDVAPMPLFWVVPLALYLGTFVLVFARRTFVPHALMLRLLPVFAIALFTVLVFADELTPSVQAPLHLATFFAAAMVCHGELARSRPDGTHATTFYLLMSCGGVLGGLFNALVAPIAFRSVIEYPLAIVLACAAARPFETASAPQTAAADAAPPARRVSPLALDVLIPVAMCALLVVAFSVVNGQGLSNKIAFPILCFGSALCCFSLKRRPVRFALGLAAFLVAGGVYTSARQPIEYRGRSYFSVYKVVVDPERQVRFLVHGRINHGGQSLDPARRREPVTYYYHSGPIGQAFASFTGPLAKPRVGVIGLGSGTLAAYAQEGQRWTFYEIDPAMEAIARDPRYFTYLQDARGDVRVQLGDGRLSLAKEPEHSFDLLIVDAFGSDSIPVHLLTREAFALYLKHLREHGVILFHVSNRFMDLQPLVNELGKDAGLTVLVQEDRSVTPAERLGGKVISDWVLMARQLADLGPLASDARWRPIARSKPVLWTDDFSNLLSVMRWY